ncbi:MULTISPECIES: HlyD family secretion protein [Pseudomonas]|uniref:HlyD family secretion protein n=2 Tax=Pseudomonas TaxID=286 RepID=A0A411MNQ7_9PSED|nr:MULTISPECIES: HlyD family secretion protein [Pseudomonas]MDD1016656.1 HlyD family secretion protein [Pseudomonas rubra]MDD1041002.1 HlyD family secretion protein [Pseudomonas rubra]MDD1153558.1 HlyD family secretion protein [Pseudomonas rubra]QBF28433.1 HlyD family secretion protein [Pseudomonas tructae]
MTLSKNHKLGLIAAALLVVGGVAYGALSSVFGAGGVQSTNDAYVSADYTVVAPKVAGFITQVLVEDNQRVKAGQTLALIDDRDFQAALAAAEAQLLMSRAQAQNAKATLERQASLISQAQATVSADEAELAFANHELTRHSRLAEQGAGTVQNAQQARSRVDQARARLANSSAALAAARKQIDILTAQVEAARGGLKHAEAALDRARLDLSYTTIVAPIDGMVGERAVRVGAYVNPGARMLSVVPLDRAYVIGNFQETQLTNVQPGQVVEVSVDTFAGERLRGHVQSVAPATGLTFAAVKPDNATGNFTKVVQRIPVKIVFDADQPLLERLRVGMSVVARIDTLSKAKAEAGNEVSVR